MRTTGQYLPAKPALPSVHYCGSAYAAAEGAHALVIATEWEQFRRLDWKRVRREMARALVVDGRNMLRPAEMKGLGFEYMSFGRPDVVAVTVDS